MSASGGNFGSWSDEPPCFHVTPGLPQADGLWHQVGNDHITALAFATGDTVAFSSDAGLVQLNQPKRSAWRWGSRTGSPLVGSGDPLLAAHWEAGAASWTRGEPGWRMTRRVWVPFGDSPTIRVDVEFLVADEAARGGTYIEDWVFQPVPIVLTTLMSPFRKPPPTYPPSRKLAWLAAFTAAAMSRSATIAARTWLGRSLRLQVHAQQATGVVLTAPQPRWYREGRTSAMAALPGGVVVAAIDAPETTVTTSTGTATRVRLETRLPDCERFTVSFVVALTAETDAAKVVTTQRGTSHRQTRAKWGRIWNLECDREPELRRESAWHASMLRGSQLVEPAWGTSYPSQGSAYGFVHGLQGAVRDYAFSLLPLCLIDPAGARSLLLTMLQLQDPDGSVRYAHTGAGHVTSAGVHRAPTDLPIAVLWAAVEYVWTTGDRGVLAEPMVWRTGGGRVTVAERLLLAWQYLSTGVGLGPSGLLRVGSGDWNDPIAAMAPNRRAFHSRGESVYNSAFAVYVLPRAATLLADVDASAAAHMAHLARRLRESVAATWTGRWFLRACDGRGGAIGADRLFLDGNAWCLIAGIGTEQQRARLIAEIRQRLDDPSPIGATCLDRPMSVRGGILAPGWDTNGGVWAALNALLAWGYARHDPDLAMRLLHKQSLAAHASEYPDTWFGIWSGPDAYNSHNAADPGGTYVQPATPMAQFPVMNSNAHAGPLFALIKTLGLESGPDGLRCRRQGPIAQWSLTTTLGHFAP